MATIEDLAASLSEIRDAMLQPFEGEAPCGEDPRYDDHYAWLKGEVAKAGGMGAGGTDWKQVAERSVTMLREQAKDLNLASYTVLAWCRLHGFAGLVCGLEFFGLLIATFWEPLFPQRLKARSGSLVWLESKLDELLEEQKSEHRPLLERGIEAVTRIRSVLSEKFDDPPANFKHLRNTLQDWLSWAPAPVEPQASPVEDTEAEPQEGDEPRRERVEPQTAAAPAQRPAAPSPAPRLEVAAPPAEADLGALFEYLGGIAGQLRILAPQSKTAYLLLRLAQWQEVRLLSHDEQRVTVFPAPAADIIDSLKNMMARSAWESLLSKAEDQFLNRWYWLDLQYYAAMAAQGLGWQEVRRVIENETHLLNVQLPTLKELKFNDNTPFAMSATKDWLAQIEQQAQGGSGQEDAGKQLLSKLRQLGGEGFAEAMVEAQTSLQNAGDRRGAFMRRLEVARFCLETEKIQWAESLCRAMIEEIGEFSVQRWEPRLAAGVWELVLRIARLKKEDHKEYEQWEQTAMREIAALNLDVVGLFPE